MASNEADIQVVEATAEFERYPYRTPLKFGAFVNTHTELLNVRVRVRGRYGLTGHAVGSMPLGNTWAFPSRVEPPDRTLAAMRKLAEAIAQRIVELDDWGHPVELAHRWEEEWLRLAGEISQEMALKEPMPKLAVLVVASAFDAALLDAYGKMHGMNTFRCLGQQWFTDDLSAFLDERFRDEWLEDYVRTRPKESLALYHLVGALDPLTDADVTDPVGDGLPETLRDWILQDRLTHLKIKLVGNDADWDIERVLAVDAVASEVQESLKRSEWFYSLDFNEQCENADYLVHVLRTIGECNPQALERVQYVEQPTSRNLDAQPDMKLHEAAQLKPVVLDEGLTDYAAMRRAIEMGYTGIALKACKGLSQSLVLAAAAQKDGLLLCVQDLTCPGLSFLESVELAAHLEPVDAVEGNARQYCPAANAAWATQYPQVFVVSNGRIDPSELTHPGLGH